MKKNLFLCIIACFITTVLVSCPQASPQSGGIQDQNSQHRSGSTEVTTSVDDKSNNIHATWNVPANTPDGSVFVVTATSEDGTTYERKFEHDGKASKYTNKSIAVTNGTYTIQVSVIRKGSSEPTTIGTRAGLKVTTSAKAPSAATIDRGASTVNVGSISLVWKEPSDLGKDHSGNTATARSYKVYWKKAFSESYDQSIPHDLEDNPYTVDNLVGNTTYDIRIRTTNSAGLETLSESIRFKTRSWTLKYEALGTDPDNNYDLIAEWAPYPQAKSYQIQAKLVNAAVYTAHIVPNDDPTANYKHILPLTDGMYHVSISMETVSGHIQQIGWDYVTTKASPPGKATIKKIEANAQEVTLEWEGSTEFGKTHDGMAALKRKQGTYEILWIEGNNFDWMYAENGSKIELRDKTNDNIYSSSTTIDLGAHTISMDGLKVGTLYSFVIVTKNNVGLTNFSDVKTVTTVPVVVSVGATEVVVKWAPKAETKSYRIEVKRKQETKPFYTDDIPHDPVPPTTEYKHALPLSAGTYTVSVSSIDEQQRSTPYGEEYDITTQALPPGIPNIDDVEVGGNSVVLKWSPTSAGKNHEGESATIASYTVFWQTEEKSADKDNAFFERKVKLEQNLTLNDLSAKTTYTVYVRATNNVGLTSAVPQVLKTFRTTGATAPSAPTNVIAKKAEQGGDGNTAKNSIAVTWNAPQNLGTSDGTKAAKISKYRLYWKASGAVTVDDYTGTKEVEAPFQQSIITGLRGNTVYTVAVVAVNDANTASMPGLSDEVRTESQEQEPSSPQNVTATAVGQRYVRISWEKPARPGVSPEGDVALFYTVYWRKGDSVSTNQYDGKSEIIEVSTYEALGLQRDSEYSFIVVAQSTQENGKASDVLFVTTGTITKIDTWEELQDMQNGLADSYQLTADIAIPSGTNFTPIGSKDKPFTGTFDGNNKRITGLTVSHANRAYAGLFGTIEAPNKDSVVIKNLKLHNPKITADSMAGAVVGYLKQGRIENVTVEGNEATVETYGDVVETSMNIWALGYAGGLAGAVGQNGILTGSASSATVKGKNTVGGLVGANKGSVTGSASGNVIGTGSSIGGLVGDNNGNVWGYARGNVKGRNSVGGLIGYNNGDGKGIAVGAVSGSADTSSVIGGLVGYNRGTLEGYATGDVIGGKNVGGLVGWNNGSVQGYALGYIKPAGTKTGSGVGPGIGTASARATGNVYVGRTATEHDAEQANEGSGDHVTGGSTSSTSPTVVVQGNASKQQTSFSGLQFGTATWEWTIETDKQWPTLRTPSTPVDVFPEQVPALATSPFIEYTSIDSWQKLQDMQADGYYKLTKDIIFPDPGKHGFPYDGFTPIGTKDKPFTGVFDGNGKTITGLSINDDTQNYAGLFGKIESASKDTVVVKDLILENPQISANAMAGAVVGYLKQGIVQNVAVTGARASVTTDGTVQETDYHTTAASYTGGLAGAVGVDATLYAIGQATVQGQNKVGGLVGINSGTVVGYTSGRVTGSDYVGGHTGDNTGSVRGYSSGAVTGLQFVGGLLGNNNGTVRGYTLSYIITRGSRARYVAQSIGRQGDKGEGLVYIGRTTTEQDAEKTSTGTGDHVTGTGSRRTNEVVVIEGSGTNSTSKYYSKNQSSFSGLAFGTTDWQWKMDASTQWPILNIPTSFPNSTIKQKPQITQPAGFAEGTGPIPIANGRELQAMKDDLSADYILIDDITLSTGTSFTPIGTKYKPFTGTLDGNNKTISDLTIQDTRLNYAGLFGAIEAKTASTIVVKDLTLENPRISANAMAGALVGSLKQGEARNVAVTATKESAKIETDDFVKDLVYTTDHYSYTGGIAGAMGRNATLTSARNAVPVEGKYRYVGGLVGRNYGGTVSGYATGSVSGNWDVGGLVGESEGTVRGYATGSVSGRSTVGGLVGWNNYGGTVSGYATGSVSGRSSGGLVGGNGGTVNGYATGSVSGEAYVGGLVGGNSGTVRGYATGSVSGEDYVGGLVGSNDYGTVRGYATGSVSGNQRVGGLVGNNSNRGTVHGYATGSVSGKSELGGLVGNNNDGGTVRGYALGYVIPTGTNTGPGLGKQSSNSISTVYIGRTPTEVTAEKAKTGSGDHVANGVSSGHAPTRVIIEGNGTNSTSKYYSKNQSSFSGLTFGTADWQWKMDASTQWPTLNIPTSFPNSTMKQKPRITKPAGFVEVASGVPIPIATWQDFTRMKRDADYVLAVDISFPKPGVDGFSTKGHIPIGSKDKPFTGTFDGNGKKIVNLYIDDEQLNYAGLFGVITAKTMSTIVVKDLTLENPQILANAMAGGLVGYLKQGEVRNVVVTATKESAKIETEGSVTETEIDSHTRSSTGGIVGVMGKSAKLTSGKSAVPVEGEFYNVGGLVGYSRSGTVSGYATGSVSGSGSVGGLVGYNYSGTVSGYATGSVRGEGRVGGLVGYSYGTVSGYATGSVSGNEDVGGLVGYNNGTVTGYATGSVSGSGNVGGLVGNNRGTASGYATGSVSGSGSVGGLVGENYYGTVSGYATGSVSGSGNVGGLVGYNGDRGTVSGYATGSVSGSNDVGGLVGENHDSSSTVSGYALGYVIPTGTSPSDIGPGLGKQDTKASTTTSTSAKVRIYVGHKSGETGDHVANGVSSGYAPTRVIIEGSGTNSSSKYYSKNQSSFSGFTFSTTDWQWKMDSSKQWPILNMPAKISGSTYNWGRVQQPAIPAKPSGFTE